MRRGRCGSERKEGQRVRGREEWRRGQVWGERVRRRKESVRGVGECEERERRKRVRQEFEGIV